MRLIIGHYTKLVILQCYKFCNKIKRDAVCFKNAMYTKITLDRYLCWWIISPQGYHPRSGQCLSEKQDTGPGLLKDLPYSIS
jgi:hypothetical protein